MGSHFFWPATGVLPGLTLPVPSCPVSRDPISTIRPLPPGDFWPYPIGELSTWVSKLNERTRILVQEIALLKHRLNLVMRASEVEDRFNTISKEGWG
jgi:hypothetical protein